MMRKIQVCRDGGKSVQLIALEEPNLPTRCPLKYQDSLKRSIFLFSYRGVNSTKQRKKLTSAQQSKGAVNYKLMLRKQKIRKASYL